MMNNTTQTLSSAWIVEQYLAFFRQRGHIELPGSPIVVPGNSTSFIIAGMQPLLPYLRGQQEPPAPCLTAFQPCLRTDDAGAVGTNSRKLTFFYMLGNWSIGNYGKREAMEMALELLLEHFGADKDTLWVTTFGDDDTLGVPPDEYTIGEWQRMGIPSQRIVSLGVEDNFWTMGGPGPCGPCTELYIDRGESRGCGLPDCRPGCDCDRFMEVWNLVFMEYERFPDGIVTRLPFLSVDTGMGLERMAAVLQNKLTVFDIDLFVPANVKLSELSPAQNVESDPVKRRARHMIVDHVRAALFAMLAGVIPGRDGRASVVRRLIRRAARQGRMLGLDRPFLDELVPPLVQAHEAFVSPEDRRRIPAIISMLTGEEQRFSRVLSIGLRELALIEPDERGLVPGNFIFDLHAEKGFPSDLAAEILAERGLSVDWLGYERAETTHHEVSRKSAKRHFGGM